MASFAARIVASFRVVRIVNSSAVFAATFVGGLLSMGGQIAAGAARVVSDGGQTLSTGGALISHRGELASVGAEFSAIALASASVSFLAAFGYALNDYYDVQADSVNRPTRPIPSGILSRQFVLGVAVFCVMAAALFAVRLDPAMWLMLAGMAALAWLYSARIKRTGLAGNVLVSLLAGSVLLLGGVSAGDARPTLFPAFLAFLVNLPREMIKDVQDVEGDLQTGGHSLASTRGDGFALRLASVCMFVVVVASFFPFLAGLYNRYYFAIVLLLDALLVWTAVSMWSLGSRDWPVSERGPGVKIRPEIGRKLETAIRMLKITMLAGLLAIGLGSL